MIREPEIDRNKKVNILNNIFRLRSFIALKGRCFMTDKKQSDPNMGADQELGSAPIGKLMARLAIPTVVAQVVNLLYNIVDRIYIGHIPEIGAEALTGVGLFMPILMLLNAFSMLAGSGGAPRAAIFMGRQDHDTA